MKARRIIGVDFDNTLVCYDGLFHKVSRERGLIPEEVPANKSEVRNYLRRIGREDDWTELQGYVYGARMAEAEIYPGAKDFFRARHAAGDRLFIISHKTLHPFRGPQHDLHRAALEWLELQGFFSSSDIALERDAVFFELTKAAKIKRIAAQRCTDFVDDLPEFLSEPAFPANVRPYLFDPAGLYPGEKFRRIACWAEVTELFAC